MTLADKAAEYAKCCQDNWTRCHFRFTVRNSDNDNPVAHGPPPCWRDGRGPRPQQRGPQLNSMNPRHYAIAMIAIVGLAYGMALAVLAGWI